MLPAAASLKVIQAVGEPISPAKDPLRERVSWYVANVREGSKPAVISALASGLLYPQSPDVSRAR
jgi:hypothetical protein